MADDIPCMSDPTMAPPTVLTMLVVPPWGGLAGAGVSQLPSLELLECRDPVLEMLCASGGVLVLLCREFGGGVTCPLLPGLRGDDGALRVLLLVGCVWLYGDDGWKGS